MLKQSPIKGILSAGILTLAVLAIFLIGPSGAFAAKLDANKVPKTGVKTTDFIPAGWSLEVQTKDDVNADGTPDFLMTLMEDKPANLKEDEFFEKDRALLIILRDEAGKLTLGAVGARVLQCGACGGAFYGVVEAPASVEVGNTGTIVIGRESGSNTVSESTMTFRWDAAAKKFQLIGYDYAYRDRTNGDYSVESINYSTGDRTVKEGKGKKETSKKTKVATKTKMYLDSVDYEKLDEEANKRLGLD